MRAYTSQRITLQIKIIRTYATCEHVCPSLIEVLLRVPVLQLYSSMRTFFFARSNILIGTGRLPEVAPFSSF